MADSSAPATRWTPVFERISDEKRRRVLESAKTAFAREGFADRAMRPDGSLVPRGEPGALVTDPAMARAQARRMIASGGYDTLCVHGDTAGAVVIARAVRGELGASDRAPAC